MMRALAVAAAVGLACNGPFLEVDLERMIDQKRYQAYQASEYFKDGRAMRSPPADTVAHERLLGSAALTTGVTEVGYVERVPIPLDREFLARGHDRYDIFCSPCHGIAGDGESAPAAHMELRRPPSLVGDEVRAFPEGRIFQVVTLGYGLMRSYSDDLALDERWAVVAYLRALQLRTGVALDTLPLALRERAEKELP
jgi:hypothetical protein